MARTLIFNFDGTGNEPSDAGQFAEDESISNVLKLHVLMGGGWSRGLCDLKRPIRAGGLGVSPSLRVGRPLSRGQFRSQSASRVSNFQLPLTLRSPRGSCCNGYARRPRWKRVCSAGWLKRGYHGIYHKMSPKHLDRYVSEFAARHNIRDADTVEQMEAIVEGMARTRLRYGELIADNGLSSGARS